MIVKFPKIQKLAHFSLPNDKEVKLNREFLQESSDNIINEVNNPTPSLFISSPTSCSRHFVFRSPARKKEFLQSDASRWEIKKKEKEREKKRKSHLIRKARRYVEEKLNIETRQGIAQRKELHIPHSLDSRVSWKIYGKFSDVEQRFRREKRQITIGYIVYSYIVYNSL